MLLQFFNDLVQYTSDKEEEQSDDDNEDEEMVEAEPFEYTGNKEEFKNLSLYISDNNIVYNNVGEILGNYYPKYNEIMDPF